MLRLPGALILVPQQPTLSHHLCPSPATQLFASPSLELPRNFPRTSFSYRNPCPAGATGQAVTLVAPLVPVSPRSLLTS